MRGAPGMGSPPQSRQADGSAAVILFVTAVGKKKGDIACIVQPSSPCYLSWRFGTVPADTLEGDHGKVGQRNH